jgi:hypothetical protein
MKIKKLLTEVEESQRVSFTAKKSVVAEIELYRSYVDEIAGVRLKRQEIIGLMIRKFLDDERDFKRWKKEQEDDDANTNQAKKSLDGEVANAGDTSPNASRANKQPDGKGIRQTAVENENGTNQGGQKPPQEEKPDQSQAADNDTPAFSASEVKQASTPSEERVI